VTEIEQRILRAVVKMVHGRKWRPKVIYLTKEDYKQLEGTRRTWRERNYVGGLEIRQTTGRYSRLHADHGHSGVGI
jgi:hypothetical protein